MVVSPQVSSALTLTAGVYHADWKMFLGSAKRQSAGLAIAIAGAAAFTWLAKVGGVVPATTAISTLELMGVRLAPTALSTVAALGAGAVGAFGYTTNQSMSLVGVMIAAALVPAAAAVGIGIAWGSWLVAGGALLLLMVNALAINVGAILTLVPMGYRPVWLDHTDLRSSLSSVRLGTISVVTVLFILSAVVTGALVGTHIAYERGMNEAVDDTFTDPAYDDLKVETVRSRYGGWPGASPNVSVTVIRTSNENDSSLPDTLERQSEQETGRDVRVTVQYTESRSGNASDVERRQRTASTRRPALGVVG